MSWMEKVRKMGMDEKGVSPVIGVILMVAITVILAATIASFVFGMGSKMQQTTPNMMATLQDYTDDSLGSNGYDYIATLKITRIDTGGVKKGEIKVVANYLDENRYSRTVSIDGNSLTSSGAVMSGSGGAQLRVYWYDDDNSGDITPGDRFVFREYSTSNEDEVEPNSAFNVQIVYKPAGATIVDLTTRVS